MILDSNGLIIMEQDSTLRANTGDSCAETCRMATLQTLLKQPVQSKVELFVTKTGVVRYPGEWAENQTSSDQIIPLLAVLPMNLLAQVISTIRGNEFCTGDGNFMTLPLMLQMMRSVGAKGQIFDDLILVLQALVFLLPIAWNPQATWNPLTWIIKNADQTANYLNFINMLAFARMKNWTLGCKIATLLCTESKALAAIESYYKPEPNSDWLITIYKAALPQIWK